MRKIILFFAVQVREENLVFIFSEQLKETMNAILNREILKTHWVRESTVGETLKKYLRLWNTLVWISTYEKYVWNNNLSASAKIT